MRIPWTQKCHSIREEEILASRLVDVPGGAKGYQTYDVEERAHVLRPRLPRLELQGKATGYLGGNKDVQAAMNIDLPANQEHAGGTYFLQSASPVLPSLCPSPSALKKLRQ